ncbi:hypothetical protein ACGFXC_13375 [Streptomyces sp. NPDC048507]|uniref:hypothetical protein n=1 Tax=Streptomyces sp. NPDC048507 TaxID=3365560 RepID=UPI0037191E20
MRTGSRTTLALTAALCAAATASLTGCGGPARDGYVAVGAAGPGPERGAGQNVAPRGPVELQALPPAAPGSAASSASAASPVATPSSTSPGVPGSGPGAGSAPGGGTATGPGGSAAPPGTPPAPGGSGSGGSGSGGSGSGGSGSGGSGSGGTPSTPGTPTPPGTPAPPPPPATPARIAIGTPARTAASERWCERVTVKFTNTGSTAARSGTVGFATHIIGALGVDWATITTSQPLPAPIAGGTSKTQTYTVCVESWRVPLGMHVDTRNVTATWS